MRKLLVPIVVILLLLTVVVIAIAQNGYDIPWWSVDGGAQRSTNGDFALSGIAGQPDAGQAMSGGEYGVTGGYWAAAVGDAPQPELKVFLPQIVR